MLFGSGALLFGDALPLSLLGAAFGGSNLFARHLALTVERDLLLGTLTIEQLSTLALGGEHLLARRFALAFGRSQLRQALALRLLGALALDGSALLAALAFGLRALLSQPRRLGRRVCEARALGSLLGALLLELGLLLHCDAA